MPSGKGCEMEYRVVAGECGKDGDCPKVIDDGDPDGYLVQAPRVDDPAVRSRLRVPSHEGLLRVPRPMLDGLGRR